VYGAFGTRFFSGLVLVVRAADVQGWLRAAADLDTVPVSDRWTTIPGRRGPMSARVYEPVRESRHSVLLVSGLHPAGVDEPRLVSLARKLAAAGVTVVTPDLPELTRLEIAPSLTDRIEDAAAWLSTEPDLAPRGRIGLMGISFSGGVSVVAAGRPTIRHRLLYVLSFGGHDDLRRVLEYLCRGTTAGGPLPHDYGLAVVLLNVVDRVVPPEQVEQLRTALRGFLWASHLDTVDKEAAGREFARLRAVARALPEPAATLLGYVNDRDVARLGPWLVPHIGPLADEPALSPSRSPPPRVPVFLLHGRDDTVIPATESLRLAARLQGRARVRIQITSLISHAEADRPARPLEVLKLAGFWGTLLEQ
jgi:dienelactone hydrolase